MKHTLIILLLILGHELMCFFVQNSALQDICVKKYIKLVKINFNRFIAIILTMGIVNLPTLQQYWSRSWPFQSLTFSILIMSRDWFLLLLKLLHLNNNRRMVPRGQPGHDKIFKVRPFVDSLLKTFQASYKMNRELSLGDAIKVAFHSFNVFPIREYGSTLYVGLARAVSPTNTNFRLTFLLTRLQEALYEDLAV